MSDLKIIGIDASLSSTGFAVADVNVDPEYFGKHKENLFKILTTSNKDSVSDKVKKSFEECFMFYDSVEIKEDKATIKRLTEIRKRIREAKGLPNLNDIALEERLEVKRITDQVEAIIKKVEDLREVDEDEDLEKTFIFIEDYSYHSPGSLTQLAEMKGLLRTEMEKFIEPVTGENNGVQTYFFITANINTVKKVAALNGNAPKDLICEELHRFGYNYTVKEDDAADATAVCLSGFYTLYHILNNFELPKCKTAKEKKFYKSFIDSLNTFATRIGSRDDLIKLMQIDKESLNED